MINEEQGQNMTQRCRKGVIYSQCLDNSTMVMLKVNDLVLADTKVYQRVYNSYV